MLEPRSYHCTIALDNSIFAIGGWDLSSIERYDIHRDEWLRLSAMREKRFAFFFQNTIYQSSKLKKHFQRTAGWRRPQK